MSKPNMAGYVRTPRGIRIIKGPATLNLSTAEVLKLVEWFESPRQLPASNAALRKNMERTRRIDQFSDEELEDELDRRAELLDERGTGE